MLSVCTLEPRKNLDTVIRSFLRLIREESCRLPAGLKLVLVGALGLDAGQDPARLRGSRKRAATQDHVHRARSRRRTCPRFTATRMAFIYLSFYEGFGLPVLEAMRCGLPVISLRTRLPCRRWSASAGILQDPRDEDALATHLQTLCNDADSARRPLRPSPAAGGNLFLETLCGLDARSLPDRSCHKLTAARGRLFFQAGQAPELTPKQIDTRRAATYQLPRL